ncbi:Acyl transferase/acyl hydrolase/lysophospholipase [Penicillium griseofulvum]|uniref:Acyl transferase/acyl hydrolase/lysophospholipase n=1 Tax=Penicillium patulum TaxID=5078 RepID=A0A135LN82_PENPA|nr:Acyl transferase/acyl hydrolase/lysophospholipase [Penicillium griseofulvum]KXG50430.1 Acyl transferase/acyl hydrolase/lysophospholipase [Penicillium griseofulvum]
MSISSSFTVKDDIAIVGYSFRLPQDVNDDQSFWEVLENRRNLRTDWPESRGNPASFLNNTLIKFPAKGGHFLNEDLGAFDAPFFSVTAQEAAAMDPMQRWTLEESYRAFEKAGIPVEKLRGSRTAVFSASMLEDNARLVAMDAENTERTAATGSSVACVVPNRVSWYFDLRGPSIHVNTACSGSLSAVDMACKSLRSGDASCALVTGCNLLLDPSIFQMLATQNFLSPDSLCYSFDERANGYARGEGTLALVLKPVSAAIEDGDMVRAVIRSTGSNQDGHTPVLTQPSPQSQEELIRHVYKQAGLSFDETRYVEAHGTGTPVGDPIEMRAIGRVFRKSRTADEPLYVGSVKANIGHLEGASALASLVKSILILEKGIIPPNALFEKINPAIDVDFFKIKVPVQSIPWPSQGLRRISVNSFGFGGSNTHVVLDDARHYMEQRGLAGNHCTALFPGTITGVASIPNTGTQSGYENGNHGDYRLTNGTNSLNGTTYTNGSAHMNGDGAVSLTNGHDKIPKVATRQPKLLVWSAADQKAVERMLESYEVSSTDLGLEDPSKLDQLAYTLASRRSRMLWRAFAVFPNPNDSQGGKSLSPVKPVRSSTDAGLAFVFTGQGAQYVGMGLELLVYPIFAQTLRQINEIYHSLGCEWSLFDELRHGMNIDKPEYSQPISTAIQIALVELLESFGVVPKAVVGHSSGEIAAAYTIGALSLLSACKVAFFRGKLTSSGAITPGGMLSINVAKAEMPQYLMRAGEEVASRLTVACINSPFNCTLSGPEEDINAVKVQADQDGLFAQKLKTGVAYHSVAMNAIADEYLMLIGTIEGADRQTSKVRARIPMVSSVSGKAIRQANLTDAQYWVNNLISPVQFSDAIQLLTQHSSTLKIGMGSITDLVEIGPHAALKRPINDTVQQVGNRKNEIRYLHVLHRSHRAIQTTLELAGQLFCLGHTISLPAVNMQSANARPQFLVDCPVYPFDRSRLYWTESRISRDFRLRGVVSGDTLGVRVSDWNPLEPRWRNFLSTESTPWTGDHKMTDTVLYPAAGMLIMAIEAVQQMVPSDRTVRGYLVKQAEFMSPIVVPQTWEERTETQVRLRPIKGSQNDSTSLFDVAVFSYSRNLWTECCNATIVAEYSESSLITTVDEGLQAMHKSAISACSRPLDSKALYTDAAEHGLQYGEMFQLLQGVCWDGKSSALAHVDLTKKRFETESMVHPAVLDQAFQVLRVASGQQRAANVPVRLVDAWFAPSGWQLPHNSSIQWFATSHTTARGDHVAVDGEQGSIYAFAENGTTLCRIQQANMTTVSKNFEETDKKLLYSIDWKPQLSLLNSKQLSQLYPANTKADETDMLVNYPKLCSLLDTVAAQTVRALDRAQVPENLRRHLEWLDFHVGRLPLSEQEDAYRMSKMEIEARMDEIERVLPTWKLYTVCAQKLPEILSGKIDPLEVIFKHDLADTFYAGLFENMCADGRLAGILELIAHENPAMRVLEVGAGTGGMTAQVLAALEERESRIGAPSFAEYNYTDISPMFLERAKGRWPRFQAESRLNFQTLDIDHGIENQGFQPASYDLIIAASVLHATPTLESTIQNVRKLLKPGGRLILLEAIKPEDVATNFMAGLVPGWWVARDKWRPHSPAVSEAVWDRCLSENGFSGNDMVIRDYNSEDCHVVSIILSTAMEEVEEPVVSRVDASNLVLVVDEHQSSRQLHLAESIHNSIDHQGEFQPRICSFSAEDLQQSLANSENDIVVCLAEVGRPLLANLSEESFKALRELLRNTPRLLWVTSSGASAADSPEYSVIQGFLRSIRAEQPSSHLISLNIEGDTDGIACANAIVNVVEKSFGSPSSQELEYVFKDGIFMTARVIEDVAGNKTIQPLLLPQLAHEPWAKTGALKLSMDTEVPQKSTIFVQDPVHKTSLGPHDVEIHADTWSFMEGDIRRAIDRTKDDLFGGNCGGVVTRVGSECNNSFQIGDRVCISDLDCMRKYPRSHETNIVKISEKLSIEAATSVFHPAILAYHALIDIARLGERDTILIHSAASSVGQIAVQIAQKQKAHVYASTTSSEEKSFLVEALGIPVEDIFDSQDVTFGADVVRATEGEGVDVVLNCLVGEDSLRGYSQCLALGGRFIEISRADMEAKLNLPREFSTRNIAFSIVDPTRLRPKPLSRLLRTVMALIGNGEIQILRPPPVFNVSQLEQIHKKIQDNEPMGQIVVTASPDDVVPQFVKEHPTWEFDNSASYLVAGGFGGIGRAILQWMVDRGAKHLIVPSRSGAVSKAAAQVVAQLTAQGVTIVAPECDVSSETSLSHVLGKCARTMPPIKGCINAAMVLQDSIFQENMTFAKWDLTMRSKVQTSWNLHRLLPEKLDFFILLSSLAGVVGQMASANYAGGCTFQDALARHRVSRGQSAISIDIGWMRNIGIIAETGAYQRQRLAADDMRPIDGAELLALLDICCHPDAPQRSPSESQILFGLRTPADHLAQGRVPPVLLDRPLLAAFSYIAGLGVSPNQDSVKQRDINPATLFRQSSDSTERIQIVHRALADKLAGAMSISSEDVEPSKPLSTYGVDSLMAVELRNWVGKTFGATVAVFDIMGGVSIASIADLVVAKSTVECN